VAKNQDALFRQWNMLRMVPRYPQKITVQSISSQLRAEGFEVTERTIQRDLMEMSAVFPLQCDDREKPYGWSWQRDAASFDLPGLTVSEALTLAMVEKYLGNLLPTPMLDQMQGFFKAARHRLDTEPKPHRCRAWLDKVQAVVPTQPLLPPKVDIEVQRVVSEALLKELQVKIQYRRRDQSASADYRIHPLGLVQRGPMLYICCRFSNYEDVRTLALHRISSATLLDERAEYPAGFSLEKTVDLGIWNYGEGTKIQLEAVFLPQSGAHLYETPLSRDQVIEELADGKFKVKATVADTPQLHWWLLGFGAGVKVIAPESLCDAIGKAARDMAKQYVDRLSSTGEHES
jgi:predicted DNA-binding transcriptional regulator YafY